MLTLCVFGDCRVDVAAADRTAVRSLSPGAEHMFAVALVLAAEAGRPVARARLAAWLWPSPDPARARPALRQTVHRLRAAGVPLVASAEHLRVLAADVAPTFAARPSAERLVTAWRSGTYAPGRCLPGWTPASRPLADWADAYRTRQERAAQRAYRSVLDDPDAEPALRVACAEALHAAGPYAAEWHAAGPHGGAVARGAPPVVVVVDAREPPDGPYACARRLARRLLRLPGALGASPPAYAAVRRLADGRAVAERPRERDLGVRIAEVAAAAADERPVVIALEHWHLADASSRAVVGWASARLARTRATVIDARAGAP